MKNANILFLLTIFILWSFLPGLTYAAGSYTLHGEVTYVHPDSIAADGLSRFLDIGVDTTPVTLEITWTAPSIDTDILTPEGITFNFKNSVDYPDLGNKFTLTIGEVVINQDIVHDSQNPIASVTFANGDVVGFDLNYDLATIDGYDGSDWFILIGPSSVAAGDTEIAWSIVDERSPSANGDIITGHFNFMDGDDDGYSPVFEGSSNPQLYDCNDSDDTINVGAADIPNDAIDQDCSGTPLYCDNADGDSICDEFDGDDTDGDGFTDAEEFICESDPLDAYSRCYVPLPFLFLLLD